MENHSFDSINFDQSLNHLLVDSFVMKQNKNDVTYVAEPMKVRCYQRVTPNRIFCMPTRTSVTSVCKWRPCLIVSYRIWMK